MVNWLIINCSLILTSQIMLNLWLVENAGNQYDENYFDTNPYREIIKSITLNHYPRQQSRRYL